MSTKKCGHYSGIGGQAVLEGVMMKNREEYAVSVRRPDGGMRYLLDLEGLRRENFEAELKVSRYEF